MKMKIDPRREIYVYLCLDQINFGTISRLNSWHIERASVRGAHSQRRQCIRTYSNHAIRKRCFTCKPYANGNEERKGRTNGNTSSSSKKILIWYRFLKSKNSPFCTIRSIWRYSVYPKCRQRWNIYEWYTSKPNETHRKRKRKKRANGKETTTTNGKSTLCACLAYLSYFPLFSHFIPYAMTVSPKIPISMPFT